MALKYLAFVIRDRFTCIKCFPQKNIFILVVCILITLGEFACDLCGKVLKSKASFAYHKRTHSGEFSYKYEIHFSLFECVLYAKKL